MTGDELGGSRFRRRVRGYDARQVDAWLSASEDSVDAGVSPLASNPGGRFPLAVRGYDIQAVDRLIDAFASKGASDGTPPVPAAGTSVTAFREPEPSDVRGSADRDRAGAPDALSVRVRSYRWKAAAFFLILAGWPASLAAMVAILQIDGAAADVHWTPSQDAVGWSAFGVVFTGLVAAVVVAVRWWRRPALQLTGQALTIYQRRPVAIPWTMITDVFGPMGSPDGRSRRIVLADGRELKVRALGRLAKLAAQRQGPPDPMAPVGSSMRSWLSFSLPEAWPVPAYPGTGQLRGRRSDQLPGPAIQEAKIRFPRAEYLLLSLVPLFLGLAVLFPGGNGGAKSGIDVVGFIVVVLVSEAVAAVAILCCWVTLSRTVVVGPGWLAWQPRLTRRWRILPLADVVSTIDLQWPRRQGVRLSRADGSGLRLRNPELAAGLGAAAGPQLAEHPAATAEFLTAVLGKQDEHRCGE